MNSTGASEGQEYYHSHKTFELTTRKKYNKFTQMKRLTLAIIAIFTFGQIVAQEEPAHMEFMGIPIDGKASEFVGQLEQKGFTTISEEDWIVKMEGIFANEECLIFVVATPETGIVWKVGVVYKEVYTSWSSMVADFNELKKLYTRKYGEIQRDVQFFEYPYELGDGFEMSALERDKCFYGTIYELKTGDIGISLISTCQIMISYEDDINTGIYKAESENAILEDI